MPFDIFVINLESRPDRKQNALNQFQRFPFCRVVITPAVAHKQGDVGCALSHLNLIRKAKQEQRDYIIVAEDDLDINPDLSPAEFEKVLTTLVRNTDKFGIFNGSPSFADKLKALGQIVKTKSWSPDFSFLTDGQKATFMVYTKKCYDEVLTRFDPYNSRQLAIDQFFARNFAQLCYKKYICYEIKSRSNIENKVVDLGNFMRQQEKIYQSILEL